MNSIRKVAILGLGLMGASLCMALKRRRLTKCVAGCARREKTRRDAVRRGIVDVAVATPAEAVAGADLVVVCLPVLLIPEMVRECRDHFAPGTIITDVGSTKAGMTAKISRHLKGSSVRFVGSHPMTGSDEAGMDSARADLYDDAVVVITPMGRSCKDAAATDVVGKFWTGVGARVCRMDATAHDKVVARTSHLPHLVAGVLTETVLRKTGGDVRELCGSGFRDSTRIAAGSEEIWHDIFKENRGAILGELGEFKKVLGRVDSMLRKKDFTGLRKFLAAARAKRLGMNSKS